MEDGPIFLDLLRILELYNSQSGTAKKNHNASSLKWVLRRFWLVQGLKVNDKISEFEIGEIMSCTAYRSGTWNFHVLMKCSKPFTLPTIGLF